MMLSELQAMLDSKEFHHATYRDIGTLWEGLHIYKKQDNGFNGFTHAGSFYKDSPDLDAARKMVGSHFVGAFNQG